MCARITINHDTGMLERLIGLPVRDAQSTTNLSWNGPPGRQYQIIRDDPDGPGAKLTTPTWGLVPTWAKDETFTMINARSETARAKPSFSNALVNGRGLLPVTGWYEWRPIGRYKQPYRIKPGPGGTVLLAVICEPPHPRGRQGETFAVLTTEPQRGIAGIHNRQPAIIDPADAGAWLEPGTGTTTIDRLAAGNGGKPLIGYPVGRQVNDPRHDHESLMAPMAHSSR